MSIVQTIDALQGIIDRLRAEAVFSSATVNHQAGAVALADQIELIIARRLEVLNRFTPEQSGAVRRQELLYLRDAIRRLTPSNTQ